MMNNKVQDDLLSIIDNFISSKDSNKNRKDFKSSIITLTEASMYYDDKGNKKSMVESDLQVFSGDTLKDIYSSLIHLTQIPKSVDAIFKFINNKIYLIEFKSGSLKENKQEHVADIYKKAYDTLLLFLEMKIIKSIEESIENIIYILVYDHSKYVNNNNSVKHQFGNSIKKKLQNSKEHLAIRNDHILQIKYFQGNVFKDAYGVDRKDFKSEILPEINAEKQVLTTSLNLE